ncbi:hypothetical protein [Streptomyces sp. NPDC058268]|uniref:effector-associated constant component EACC1 n=1 Tax=Streptomyces sp. NPDC058268 TaxID=3346413 RepID=UPI0036E3C0EE
MPTEVQIRIDKDDAQKHLESLESWLRLDPSFRRKTKLHDVPSEGDLGTSVELLTVAIGSGGVISVLATSLSTWIQQPRKSDIILKVARPNGETVEIDAKRATPQEVNELLNRALEADREASE